MSNIIDKRFYDKPLVVHEEKNAFTSLIESASEHSPENFNIFASTLIEITIDQCVALNDLRLLANWELFLKVRIWYFSTFLIDRIYVCGVNFCFNLFFQRPIFKTTIQMKEELQLRNFYRWWIMNLFPSVITLWSHITSHYWNFKPAFSIWTNLFYTKRAKASA